MKTLPISLLLIIVTNAIGAADFDITQYGATPNDGTDDTQAIKDALTACGSAGGGKVLIPAGTFIVSRQGSETCILEVPSNTTV